MCSFLSIAMDIYYSFFSFFVILATFKILNRYKAYIKQRNARHNFYKILDIRFTSSQEDIKKAVKKRKIKLEKEIGNCANHVSDE